jgi:hypothetical protein
MHFPRSTRLCLLPVLALLLAAPLRAQEAPQDDYSSMLHYLTDAHIDGQALSGANGVVSVNMAAGDFNQQANLHAFAIGENATTRVRASQQQRSNLATPPDRAGASIGDGAFSGAQGVLSINQASGNGNTELNVVTAALATQGIREAGDAWFATASASAGGAVSPAPPAASGSERHVAVESTAMREVHGVVQLNQVAGSANAAANVLQMSVSQPQQ